MIETAFSPTYPTATLPINLPLIPPLYNLPPTPRRREMKKLYLLFFSHQEFPNAVPCPACSL